MTTRPMGRGGRGTPRHETKPYSRVQDEGVLLPPELILNFIGVAVTAVDDPANNRTNVTIVPSASSRSALPGTVIDHAGDEIRFKTLTVNTTFTIINPTLGRVVVVELDGVFTVTLPASVNVVNGDYCPALGTNYLYLYCTDDATPTYQGVWTVQV